MRPMSRRGFTVIELLIVIAIILILVSLVIVGVRVLATSGRNNQTKTLLQTMSGVTAELKLKSPPTSSVFYSGTAAMPAMPMVSPGDVTADSGAGNRTGSPAVLATASVMVQAMAIPDVQTALNSLPAAQLTQLPPPAARLWVWAPNAPYRVGDYVVVVNTGNSPPAPSLYHCVNAPLTFPATVPPTADWASASWPPALAGSTRMPLDAWGNPMIFVPAGGLAGVQLSSDSPGTYRTIVSPDGQPFWASAGPDGNFSTGDDNVYSFQK